MLKRKHPKTKGRFSLSKFFQILKPGDTVAVVREHSQKFSYPIRLQGRSGKVIEKRGTAYYVEIKDFDKPKKYLIRPIHLKKLKNDIK